MSGGAGPLLELRDVRKSFGSVEAVAGVSDRFQAGEYVCILGPSGCGKTTLLRMVAGFEEPTAGEILLDGASIGGVPPERRDVNVVFQSYALFPHLSVRENVSFGPRMKRMADAEVKSRTDHALDLVRMGALDKRLPRQLSGGQQQRVALARALVNRPRLLLLDEPLSALDRSLRLEMQDELRALQREIGLTFLHVTHDQAEAMSLADRLVVMRAGRFEQVGPPRELYQQPRNRFVAEFLGSSNLLEGTVEEPGVVRTSGGLRVSVMGADYPERVLLSVRPEAVGVEPLAAGDAAATRGPDDGGSTAHLSLAAASENRFRGRVAGTSFSGATLECRLTVAGHLLRAQLSGRAASRVPIEGDEVWVSLPLADIVTFTGEDAELEGVGGPP